MDEGDGGREREGASGEREREKRVVKDDVRDRRIATRAEDSVTRDPEIPLATGGYEGAGGRGRAARPAFHVCKARWYK